MCMLRATLPLLLLIFVTSCASPPVLPPVVDTDKDSCEALGGKWGAIGLFPEEVCNLPTSDAGKVCSDAVECEGSCLAETATAVEGKCTPWTITIGCRTFMFEGEAKNICVD